MKQLFYTSCVTGKSVGGGSGFQIRAVSPGVSADSLHAVVRHVSYSLPVGTSPDDETASQSPVRLALLNTSDAGRVLCHSVYVGKDPMTGRWGNFFTHLLLNVPPDFSALDAIYTWASDFWHRADDGGGIELQDVFEMPSEKPFDDQQLAEFLGDESHLELVRFVIAALLRTPSDHRIVVAATAATVAHCVYAVTQALPQSMLQDLTFSTYESEPLTCGARLIGTTLGDDHGADLPSSCYSGSCVGYNTYSGRKTEFSLPIRFVDYAVGAMTSAGKREVWRKLCRVWETCDVRDPHLIDMSFRFFLKSGAEELTKEDAVELLQNHGLAVYCIQKTKEGGGFLERVISWGITDGPSYQSLVPLLLSLLRWEPSLAQWEGLSKRDQGRLQNWMWLDEYSRHTSVDPDQITRLGDVITDLAPHTCRLQVASQFVSPIAEVLGQHAEKGSVTKQLNDVLQQLGHLFPNNKAGLFCKIARSYSSTSRAHWRSKNLTYALASVGCSERLAFSFPKVILPEVKRIVRLTKSHDRRGAYTSLARRTTGWPKRCRGRWKRASRTVWFYLIPSLCTLATVLALATILHAAGLVQVKPLERVHVRYGVLRSGVGGDSQENESGTETVTDSSAGPTVTEQK